MAVLLEAAEEPLDDAVGLGRAWKTLLVTVMQCRKCDGAISG